MVSNMLVSKGIFLWLICFEDLQLSVLLMTDQNLDYLFIFDRTRFKKNPQLFLLLSGISLVVKWSGYDSCVEYLSRIYLIKLVEIFYWERVIICSQGVSLLVVPLIVVFLQHGVDCKLENPLCFTRPDQDHRKLWNG
jgi:hypothetical protein